MKLGSDFDRSSDRAPAADSTCAASHWIDGSDDTRGSLEPTLDAEYSGSLQIKVIAADEGEHMQI